MISLDLFLTMINTQELKEDYSWEAILTGEAYIPSKNFDLIGKTLEVQLYYLLDFDTCELYVCHKRENGEMRIWNEGKILQEVFDYYKNLRYNK